MNTNGEAKNIAGIRAWMEKHRPDLIDHLDRILAMENNGDNAGSAMLLLLTVGFAAGRTYQRENPGDVENF